MKLNIVPARTGILWVKLGIKTFLKQPLALTGLFFMYMATVLVISQPTWGVDAGAAATIRRALIELASRKWLRPEEQIASLQTPEFLEGARRDEPLGRFGSSRRIGRPMLWHIRSQLRLWSAQSYHQYLALLRGDRTVLVTFNPEASG